MFRKRGKSDGGAEVSRTIADFQYVSTCIQKEAHKRAESGPLTWTAKFGAVYNCAFNAVYPKP